MQHDIGAVGLRGHVTIELPAVLSATGRWADALRSCIRCCFRDNAEHQHQHVAGWCWKPCTKAAPIICLKVAGACER